MVNKAINRFDVQVVFPDLKLNIKNRPGVVLTPADVVRELEAFCARVRDVTAAPAKPALTP